MKPEKPMSKLKPTKSIHVYLTPESIDAITAISTSLQFQGQRGSYSDAIRYAVLKTAQRIMANAGQL